MVQHSRMQLLAFPTELFDQLPLEPYALAVELWRCYLNQLMKVVQQIIAM